MLNKEKFRDEIIEIATQGDSVAVKKDNKKIVPCETLDCLDCLFYLDDERCFIQAKKYWNSEYIDEPLINDTEYILLSNLDSRWMYIVKEVNEKTLYLFTGKPYLTLISDGDWIWDCDVIHNFTELPYSSKLFKQINNQSNEPYLIKDLLHNYEVWRQNQCLGE